MWSMTFGIFRTFVAGLTLVAPLATALACEPSNGLERISRGLNGQSANDRSLLPAINGDGCVIAFKSYASNLVENDLNEKVDVFALDRNVGAIERVPVRPATGSSGNPNDNSFPPALNFDGTIVAFSSLSNNLTAGDFNTDADVFVYDRPSQTTSILTLRDDGELGGGAPDLPPSLSDDGRFVAFSAASEKIVSSDRNQANDVFVYDRDSGGTELISVATAGSDAGRPANRASNGAVISADGCTVAFYSEASNVIAGDRNDVRDVFVRDRCSGASERVSIASDGSEANAASQAAGFQPGISGDGQLVVFGSDATNLAEGDDNGVADVFLRDRSSQATTRLSRGLNGESANGASQFPAISADGRFVAFQSAASNLVENDTNQRADIFVVELATGLVRRIGADQVEPNGNSTAPQLNADGTIVVFQSDASNLTDDDGNGVGDVFAASNPLSLTPTPTDTVEPTVTETPVPPTATATASPTSTRVGAETPLPPTLAPSTTRTATVSPSATPTATGGGNNGNGNGGGDGCSCRVDPQTGEIPDSAPLAVALLPLGLWMVRRRGVRRAGAH